MVERLEWYHKEKLKLDNTGFSWQTKEYIRGLLIRAIQECGTINK